MFTTIFRKLFLMFLWALLSSATAFAGPLTFGPEFEFSHPSIIHSWKRGGEEEAAHAKMLYVEQIKKLCKSLGCRVYPVEGKWLNYATLAADGYDYKVEFSDMWWFKISHDPGCIEITAKPSTIDDLKSRKDLINKIIFKSGESLGFYIPENDTAHFNIGFKSAFENDGDHFLRFFTDYQNRPELALGLLGEDLGNGAPLALLDKNQRLALENLIKKNSTAHLSPEMIAKDINNFVYTRSYIKSWGGKNHYQAIGLKYIKDMDFHDNPFEMRAIWNQKDIDHFIKLAELFTARINYLKTKKNPIYYNQTDRSRFTLKEKLTRFYIYITECGLNYENYKFLLPKNIQKSSLDVFLDEKASRTERIKNLARYSDIMIDSAFLQQKALKILNVTTFSQVMSALNITLNPSVKIGLCSEFFAL